MESVRSFLLPVGCIAALSLLGTAASFAETSNRLDVCSEMNFYVRIVQKPENESNYLNYQLFGNYARACSESHKQDGPRCDALMKAGDAFYKSASLQESNGSGFSPILVTVDYAKAYDAFSNATVPCTGLRKDDAQRGWDTTSAALHRLGIPKP